jgi:membrane protease subunit (stomatin/prohibitin family)
MEEKLMGIMDFIKSQFIEVIEWTETSADTMVYRFPVQGKEIKMGAQLTVRESQSAIFVNEGTIADVYGPGRYELTTQNMPILTKLKSWKYGFNSPFKAEVYFVNMRQYTDRKWGTTNPVMMRDKEFGPLRLRAFGIYSFKVDKPEIFLKEVFGTSAEFTVDAIEGQIKRSIVSGLSDILGEANIPALDLASRYDELSALAKDRMQTRVSGFGLVLSSFFIENISLPEEVEKVLDKRTSMGVIGDLGKFAQYQSAEAIREAANNPNGGVAGAGVGLGAGVALGQMMGQSLNAAAAASAQPAPAVPVPAAVAPSTQCPSCGKPVVGSPKFCPECGGKLERKCVACGADLGGAKFCPECGAKA